MAILMKCTAIALAAALATSVWANPPAGSDRLAEIVAQQRALQQDLDGMEGLTTRQRNAIRKTQVQVFALTEGKAHIDEMTIDEKVRLENALERINAELVNTRAARDSQQKCHIEKKTGSKLGVTRCASMDERDQVRQGARAYMERPRVCAGLGCGQ